MINIKQKQQLIFELKELEQLIHDYRQSIINFSDDDIIKSLDMFESHFSKLKHDYIIIPCMNETKKKDSINVIAKA